MTDSKRDPWKGLHQATEPLSREDSERLLANLENCCSPEESDRRSQWAADYLDRVMPEREARGLQTSAKVCALADMWRLGVRQAYLEELPQRFVAALDELAELTRPSPLRKVP